MAASSRDLYTKNDKIPGHPGCGGFSKFSAQRPWKDQPFLKKNNISSQLSKFIQVLPNDPFLGRKL